MKSSGGGGLLRGSGIRLLLIGKVTGEASSDDCRSPGARPAPAHIPANPLLLFPALYPRNAADGAHPETHHIHSSTAGTN